jgi:hypothetical protein
MGRIAVSLIVAAIVLSIIMFVNGYGRTMQRSALNTADQALLQRSEGAFIDVNSFEGVIPVAGIIQFIDVHEGTLTSVRTIRSIDVNAQGRMVEPAPNRMFLDGDFEGTFMHDPICFRCWGICQHNHLPEAQRLIMQQNSGCRIMEINNNGHTLVNGLFPFIGQRVYIYIVSDFDGNNIAYLSLQWNWV